MLVPDLLVPCTAVHLILTHMTEILTQPKRNNEFNTRLLLEGSGSYVGYNQVSSQLQWHVCDRGLLHFAQWQVCGLGHRVD